MMVPSAVRVVTPTISVVTLEVIVASELTVAVCVKTGALAFVPLTVNWECIVVGNAVTIKDWKVVTKTEVLLTTSVSTSVNTDVTTTVVTGMVMLVVNLDTDVEMGTSRAPLGRDTVELTGGDVMLGETAVVLDEIDDVLLVETGGVVDDELVLSAILWAPPSSMLLLRLVEDETEGVDVSEVMVVERDVEDAELEVDPVVVVDGCSETLVCVADVLDVLLLWARMPTSSLSVVVAPRVVDEMVSLVVVPSTVAVVVLVTARATRFGWARARRFGCEAFGWRPRMTTLVSESGNSFSATTTRTIATRSSAMTAPMKGQRSAVGL